MSILRTIKCDLCENSFTEDDTGTGFPGWVIVNGIGTVDPKEQGHHTYECNNLNLCPDHGQQLARLITEHMEGKT